VQVLGPDGKAVPAQVLSTDEHGTHILFLAKLPSVGFAVLDVRPAAKVAESGLKVDERSLENERYRVMLDANGDVASILDKKASRELLSAPARVSFQYENPANYPAWNMDWNDRKNPPRAYVEGPAKVRVVEKGPVRGALEVEREAQGSKCVQRIRLAPDGAGDGVEFDTHIECETREPSTHA